MVKKKLMITKNNKEKQQFIVKLQTYRVYKFFVMIKILSLFSGLK